nr:MAG TPA: hypothetical protein [Caudoviricetes sp.]
MIFLKPLFFSYILTRKNTVRTFKIFLFTVIIQ